MPGPISRPDLIDSALLRPGRLDKSLLCNMPNVQERKEVSLTLAGPCREIEVGSRVDS